MQYFGSIFSINVFLCLGNELQDPLSDDEQSIGEQSDYFGNDDYEPELAALNDSRGGIYLKFFKIMPLIKFFYFQLKAKNHSLRQ